MAEISIEIIGEGLFNLSLTRYIHADTFIVSKPR